LLAAFALRGREHIAAAIEPPAVHGAAAQQKHGGNADENRGQRPKVAEQPRHPRRKQEQQRHHHQRNPPIE